MARFLVATDSEENSERLCAYLSGRVGPDDSVIAVNSLRGGEATDERDVRRGEDALEAVTAGLDAAVESHQFVRGNDPAEDVLAAAEEWDVDEVIIGVRKRNPTGKVIFGSTAQDVLLESTRPVVCVPQPR